jgi:hypothetical protein
VGKIPEGNKFVKGSNSNSYGVPVVSKNGGILLENNSFSSLTHKDLDEPSEPQNKKEQDEEGKKIMGNPL